MATISASLVKELRERTGLGMMDCKKALEAANGDIEQAIDDLRKSGSMKAAKKAGRVAAEGVAATRVSDDGRYGVMVEVNSETDFVARDANFLAFVQQVVDAAFDAREASLDDLMAAGLETARTALVQKIGENISVRRVMRAEAADGVLGNYVHGNSRIAVLVTLKGGNAELAKDIAMHVAASNPAVVTGNEVSAETLEKEKEIIRALPDMQGKPADIVEKMVAGRISKYLKEISLVDQPFVKNPEITVAKLAKDAGAEVLSFVRYEVGEGIEKAEVDFAAEVAAAAQTGR
ncbi:MAG TPA: translation elongation factor Ts [Pseudomonadales bacterium]|jgi:elongation factor Ts